MCAVPCHKSYGILSKAGCMCARIADPVWPPCESETSSRWCQQEGSVRLLIWDLFRPCVYIMGCICTFVLRYYGMYFVPVYFSVSHSKVTVLPLPNRGRQLFLLVRLQCKCMCVYVCMDRVSWCSAGTAYAKLIVAKKKERRRRNRKQ